MRDILDKDKIAETTKPRLSFPVLRNLKRQSNKAFGTVDELRAAGYQMDESRHRDSASDYAARSWQLASRLVWDDGPLMSACY